MTFRLSLLATALLLGAAPAFAQTQAPAASGAAQQAPRPAVTQSSTTPAPAVSGTQAQRPATPAAQGTQHGTQAQGTQRPASGTVQQGAATTPAPSAPRTN